MEQEWLRNTSFKLQGYQSQQGKSEGLTSAGVDRKALLKAAEGILSSSSEESDGPARSRSTSPRRERHAHENQPKEKKRKKDKHGHKKKRKRHRADSDYEKIRRIEQQAGVWNQPSSSVLLPARPTASSQPTKDSAYLDTTGDIKNSMYQSLYAGDIPRYNRLDPLNLVSSNRSLKAQQQQLTEGNQTGSLACDRYYRGRHMLQHRNRSMKRIHVADLRPPQQQQAPASKLLLFGTAPPPPAAASGMSGTGSRKLKIPEPEFIPLTAEAAKPRGPEAEGLAGLYKAEPQSDVLQEVSHIPDAPREGSTIAHLLSLKRHG
jgi:hypothetical protein